MLSIFIMLIIAIGLCAGIGYSILTLIKTGEVSLNIQKNQVRMEVIASAIRSSLVYKDGNVWIPVEMEGSNPEGKVPSIAPYSTTTYGKNIVYCPISPLASDAGSGVAVQMPDGEGAASYPVRIESPTVSRHYVTAGAPAFVAGVSPDYTGDTLAKLREMNVVALLISPDPNVSTTLSCSSVTLANPDNLIPLISGGSITAVYKSGAALDGSTDETSKKTYLFSGSPAGTQTDYVNFIAAETGQSGLPETILDLTETGTGAENDVDASLESIGNLATATDGRILRIIGNPAHPAVIKVLDADAQGKAEVAFSGDVYMDNVIFEGHRPTGNGLRAFDVVLAAKNSGRLFLNNVVVDGYHVDGGRIAVTGPDSLIAPEFGAADGPIVIEGGELSIAEAVKDGSAVASVLAPNATTVFSVKGGKLTFEGQPVIVTGENAKMVQATGNARIASTQPEVAVQALRGQLPITSETVFPPQSYTQATTCETGSTDCTASCPAGTKVTSGSCSSGDGHALAGFGNAGDASYLCSWAAPVPSASPVSPTATAICR